MFTIYKCMFKGNCLKPVFKYVVKRPNEVQEQILKGLMWHVAKVYNTMIYSIIDDQTDIPDRIEKVL